MWTKTPRDLLVEPRTSRRQDAAERQLRGIERQRRGMALIAHVCAFALVVVFSLGSLVALSGEALSALILQWGQGGINVPAAISIVVSVLLVASMDTALIYAAAMVRLLTERRQRGAHIHIAVIAGVSAVEAGTYLYMSSQYDHPTNWAVWTLIIARALSAPLTAVYLSLAQALPITARDILYQVELATGRGVIRDVVALASDGAAPLERKMLLYREASSLPEEDLARLDALIAATHRPLDTTSTHAKLTQIEAPDASPDVVPTPVTDPAEAAVELPDASRPNDASNPSTSTPSTRRRSGTAPKRATPSLLRFSTPDDTDPDRGTSIRRKYSRSGTRSNVSPVRTGRSREGEAREAWRRGADTVTKVQRATGMSRSAAARWLATFKAERQGRVAAR